MKNIKLSEVQLYEAFQSYIKIGSVVKRLYAAYGTARIHVRSEGDVHVLHPQGWFNFGIVGGAGSEYLLNTPPAEVMFNAPPVYAKPVAE